jgi:hypothetical protein
LSRTSGVRVSTFFVFSFSKVGPIHSYDRSNAVKIERRV